MIQIILILMVVILTTLFVDLILKYIPHQKAHFLILTIFIIYILGNMYFTVLSRTVGSGAYVDLRPFGTYLRMFETIDVDFENATGFAAFFLKGTSPLSGVILNILLYYPMGYLLPALFPRMKPIHVLLIGAGASAATELSQYLFAMGWCEMDDFIHNTSGAAIGLWVWLRRHSRLAG